MNNVRAGRVAALLGLALAVSATPASAQYYNPAPTMKGNWVRDLLGMAPSQPVAVKDAELEVPTTRVEPAIDQQQLLKDLNRRQDVCYRLREIALATDNMALEAEAEQLDRLAFQIYQARLRKLPSGHGSSAVGPEASDAAPSQAANRPTSAPSSPAASSEGKR